MSRSRLHHPGIGSRILLGLTSAALLPLVATAAAPIHGGSYNPPPPPPPPSTPNAPASTGVGPAAGPRGPGQPAGGGSAQPAGKTGGAPAASTPATPGPATSGPACPGPSTGSPSLPVPVSTGTPRPGPDGSATGGAFGSGLESWEDWWNFNRAAYLDLRRAVTEPSATFAGDGMAEALAGGRASAERARRQVVPVLRHLLESERANDIATGALIALARIGDPSGAAGQDSSLPALMSALSDPNQETAETAALSLGLLRSEEGIAHLESLLAGDARGRALCGSREISSRTRAFAAYGLGLMAERAGSNRARQLLARALTQALESASRLPGPDVEVASVLALSLDRLDAEARESTSAPWVSRQTLVRRLLEIHADPQRRTIVRAHAATALARLAQDAPQALREGVAAALMDALVKDPGLEIEVVQSTILALGLLGDDGDDAGARRIRAALVARLESPHHLVRHFALIALAQAGAREGRGPDGEPSPGAGQAASRNALLGELARGRTGTRPWAALALGVLERRLADRGAPPSAAAREALRTALSRGRTRNDVGSAAIALGLCRDPEAAPLLLAKLRETGEDTGRGQVALALGMIGAREAVEPLRTIVRESALRPALLEHAAVALALLGDREVVPDLVAMLERAQGLHSQASLARALGAIGDPRAVEPLLRLAQRRELPASARGFAIAALGRVVEDSPLPWHASISADLNYRASPASLLAGNGTGLLEIL